MTGVRSWAVVVLNHNRAADTITCLESVAAAAARPGAVFLVDNASIDDSVERVREWARRRNIATWHGDAAALDSRPGSADEWLTIVRAPDNAGFAIGNNLALRYIRERTAFSHALLLNNDAAVAPDFFGLLAAALEDAPDAGLATGTIYQWDRRTVWYAGGTVNPVRALVCHNFALPQQPGPQPTDFVCGCSMLISRPVLERVGLLPECYSPFYGEDADYSLRVRAAGFTPMYVPGAAVYHRVGATLGPPDRSPLVTWCLNRHRAFIIRRNFSGWRRAAGLGYMAVTKPGRAIIELASGRPRIAWAVLAGTASGLFSRAARTA